MQHVVEGVGHVEGGVGPEWGAHDWDRGGISAYERLVDVYAKVRSRAIHR